MNGSLASFASIVSVGSTSSNVDFRISGNSSDLHPFVGSVDDVAVWGRALSNAEILEIYQRMRPKFY